MAILWRRKGDQLFDDSAVPLNGGKLYYYDATTTNEKTVYQDSGLTIEWDQPIVLLSNGRLSASIYIGTGAFKEVQTNSAGSTSITEDSIPGAAATPTTTFTKPLRPIVTKAANYTVTTSDIGSLFVVDSTGGGVTLSLPDAALVANGTGIGVLHVGSANTVILDGSGSQLVGLATTLTLLRRGNFVEIVSDGASSWAAEAAQAQSTDLTAIAALTSAADKLPYATGAGTWALATFTSAGRTVAGAADAAAQRTALALGTIATQDANNATLTLNAASVITNFVATQAQQEAGSDGSVYTSPARQHFHPSAAKCWGYVTVSAGTPTLQNGYNLTSITDTATGRLTVTINTDFSSANWACAMSVTSTNVTAQQCNVETGSQAAGSVILTCYDGVGGSGGTQSDPAAWHMVGYGDQ